MTNGRPPGAPPRRPGGHSYPDGLYEPRTARRAPQAARGSSPVLVGLVYGGIAILALAVAGVTFLMMAPPTDLIRREVVAQVKAETGRDLTIAGPVSFTVFP